MALIGFRSGAGPALLSTPVARSKAWLSNTGHSAVAQRMAGSTFLIRLIGAGIIFLSQIVFARWMGSFEFGVYVSVYTWYVLLGSLSSLGIAYLGQRFIPEYIAKADEAALRGYLAGSRWLCFGLGSALALVGVGVILALESHIPSYYVFPLVIALAALPIYAVSSAQDSIARSYNWVGLAFIPAFIVQPILMLAGMVVLVLTGLPVNALIAMGLVAGAEATGMMLQWLLLRRRLAGLVPRGQRRYEVSRWLRTAMPVFLVSSFYLLLTHTDILALQVLAAPDRVAIYYAAVKCMALVAYVHYAVSAAYAHRFSESHYSGGREQLEAFVEEATRWTFWPTLAIICLLIAVGRPILMLFGPDFVAGYPLIFVLAIGLLARASVGPAERLLSMLGEQRACAGVYGTAFLLNLFLCLILIPRIGMAGAAISIASAMVVESILLFLVAKMRLGLHVFVLGGKAAIWGRQTGSRDAAR